MKRIPFIAVLLLLILSAFSAKLIGQTTKEAGQIFINKKGEIHNQGWTKLGYIDKDDIVRNAKGQKLYFIDQKGNVIDANGKNLGMAKKNGSYFNINGENIIKVGDEDAALCKILDPKGHNLGSVHKNYKLHACAAHCYFLTSKYVKHGG